MAAAQHEQPLEEKATMNINDKPQTSASSTNESKAESEVIDTDEQTPEAAAEAETETETEESNSQHVTGIKLVAVASAISLACFLVMLDMSIIATAIPEITTVFNSLGDVGWYGSAYLLSSASLQPLTGKLYTHYSIKWLFIGFVSVFEIGSLICALANSSTMLILGRMVAGLGSSGIMNGALTIIATVAPLEKRPALTGMVMGISQIGIILGPLAGGAFTQYTTWRWCFYINLPVGGVALLVLMLTRIPGRNQSNPETEALSLSDIPKRLDLIGFGLFAPAAVMFLLALEYGSDEFGWDSSQTIGLFVGSGLTAIVFLLWEYRVGENAMIPLSLFRNRVVALSTLLGVTIMCAAILSSYYIPIYFQSVKGAGPMLSGVYLLPLVLSQLLFAVGGGVLMGKLGYYLPWAVAGSALNAIGSGLLTTLSPSTGTGSWVGFQIILGAGRGVAMQVPIIATQANLPAAQISTAMAILIFAQTFGGAIFLSIGDLIFSERLRSGLESHVPEIDADAVIAAGGIGFRRIVPDEYLPGALQAYSEGVTGVFYLLLAMASVGFFLSFGIGWKNIKKNEPKPEEKTEV